MSRTKIRKFAKTATDRQYSIVTITANIIIFYENAKWFQPHARKSMVCSWVVVCRNSTREYAYKDKTFHTEQNIKLVTEKIRIIVGFAEEITEIFSHDTQQVPQSYNT